MAAVDIDVAEWPIVVITPPGDVSDRELDEYFESYERTVLSRGQRFSIVLDLRRSADMPANQRRMLTDRMQAQEAHAKQYIAITVLVFQSPVMRALLTAILWVRKPQGEMRIAATRKDATELALAFMRETRKGPVSGFG